MMKNLSTILDSHRSTSSSRQAPRPGASAPSETTAPALLIPSGQGAAGAEAGEPIEPLDAGIAEALQAMPEHLAHDVGDACDCGFGAPSSRTT